MTLQTFLYLLGLILCIALAFWLVGRLTAWLAKGTESSCLPKRMRKPANRSTPPWTTTPSRRPCRRSGITSSPSDTAVICYRPDDTSERVDWADLQKVQIRTTSDGPFLPDVFWLLHGTSGGCSIPQGASGEKELFALLQALPGFDNQAFIQSMTSTQEALFTCWTRPTVP